MSMTTFGRLYGLLSFGLFGWLMLPGPASQAASVPAGFIDREVAAGLLSPTAMTVLPDGRVLVVQQDGVIRLLKNDVLLPAPFYSVPAVDTFSERGCLGIVADPAFAANRQLYVYCTIKADAAAPNDGKGRSNNQVFRLTEAGDAAGSAQVFFALPDVPAGVQWHMGGAMRFGVDGKLYIAVGGHEDLRVEPAKASFSQTLTGPFGKIIRINPDGSFPPDNPFYTVPGAWQGIYNLGLRNPFSFDIQPGTGLMLINDVGGGSVEEINLGAAGANYGWPVSEGRSSDPAHSNALYEYRHTEGLCAITGAVFYNPLSPQFPANFVGNFLYADFCAGSIFALDPANPVSATPFAGGIGSPVNLALAPDGSLYYLARNQDTGKPALAAGTVGKITYSGALVPRLAVQPLSQTIFVGDPVVFSVQADDAQSYQWQRNGVSIAGATAASFSLAAAALTDHLASFTVVVGNAAGTVVSSPAVLTITSNRLPLASIASPAPGSDFVPGELLAYAGAGNDAEDGVLPASAFTWQIDFRHDTHAHPAMAPLVGIAGGSYLLPEFEADLANTWFRITLLVKDGAGQVGSAIRDIYPRLQLGDQEPLGTPVNGLGEIGRNLRPGVPPGVITLDGIAYAKGLSLHAPAAVRYQLAGRCHGHLIADVGIDDMAGDQGSVVFQAFLDEIKVYDSAVLRGSDTRAAVFVPVAGQKELRLVAGDAGDGNGWDVANWGGVRVTGCAPVTASP